MPRPAPVSFERRALGVPSLVFFVVAASAPLTAVAGGQATTYLVTGNKGLPLLFIPLSIVLGIFAIGYAAMSRHVADAGAFYTYVVRGLGRIPGVGAAFVALMSYNAMQIGICGLFGVATSAFMADKLGITLDWYWWCLIGGAVIAVLGALQIDLNARVLAVCLVLEVIIVALFDIAIGADPGPQGLSGVGFSPHAATDAALGAALVFNVAAFVGFESAAIYSEECRVLITGSTTAPTDSMAIVLPALVLVAGVVGMLVAAALRARAPERYAHIGERTAVEQAEHVA